jgi:hypothetical protein
MPTSPTPPTGTIDPLREYLARTAQEIPEGHFTPASTSSDSRNVGDISITSGYPIRLHGIEKYLPLVRRPAEPPHTARRILQDNFGRPYQNGNSPKPPCPRRALLSKRRVRYQARLVSATHDQPWETHKLLTQSVAIYINSHASAESHDFLPPKRDDALHNSPNKVYVTSDDPPQLRKEFLEFNPGTSAPRFTNLLPVIGRDNGFEGLPIGKSGGQTTILDEVRNLRRDARHLPCDTIPDAWREYEPLLSYEKTPRVYWTSIPQNKWPVETNRDFLIVPHKNTMSLLIISHLCISRNLEKRYVAGILLEPTNITTI